uniref:Uncharacterized protein n=1 Tax=Cacopsylla melanoneura TaxID=428564 RepID=A0A8D8REV7_9HEMI
MMDRIRSLSLDTVCFLEMVVLLSILNMSPSSMSPLCCPVAPPWNRIQLAINRVLMGGLHLDRNIVIPTFDLYSHVYGSHFHTEKIFPIFLFLFFVSCKILFHVKLTCVSQYYEY